MVPIDLMVLMIPVKEIDASMPPTIRCKSCQNQIRRETDSVGLLPTRHLYSSPITASIARSHVWETVCIVDRYLVNLCSTHKPQPFGFSQLMFCFQAVSIFRISLVVILVKCGENIGKLRI